MPFITSVTNNLTSLVKIDSEQTQDPIYELSTNTWAAYKGESITLQLQTENVDDGNVPYTITGLVEEDFERIDFDVPQLDQTVSNSVNNSYFGSSSSISDDETIMVVGSPEEDSYSGRVYTYDLDSEGNWNLRNVLSGGVEQHYFGSDVSLSPDGQILIVGAPYKNGIGRVYTYDLDSEGNWVLRNTLADSQSGTWFGSGVSLSKYTDVLVVGAPNPSENHQGKVYTYELDPNDDWVPRGDVLTHPNPSGITFFGKSVEVFDDSLLFVGSTKDNTGRGSVYIYDMVDNNWSVRSEFISGEYQDQYLGSSISFCENKNLLAIGSSYLDIPGTGNLNQGGVYLFDLIDDVWVQRNYILYGDSSSDYFGSSVSISDKGNILIIGSGGKGSVGIFNLTYPAPLNGNFELEDGSAEITYTLKNQLVTDPVDGFTVSLDGMDNSIFRSILDPNNPEESTWWNNSGWKISESSWKDSPIDVVEDGEFENGTEGWQDESSENFTDVNGDDYAFDSIWDPGNKRMRLETTPNDLGYESVTSKNAQYPFESGVNYFLKTSIHFAPEDVTTSTKTYLSIWDPETGNSFSEQSFNVSDLNSGQEVSLNFTASDQISKGIKFGFRLSDNSSDNTKLISVGFDDVKITDSNGVELQRNYILSVSQAEIDEGDSVTVTLNTEGLIDGTKVSYFVEKSNITGSSFGWGSGEEPNVFTVVNNTSSITIQTEPDSVCVTPQTVSVWVPHPELNGINNSLSQTSFVVNPRTDLYDKSYCSASYTRLVSGNDTPTEGGGGCPIGLEGVNMRNGLTLDISWVVSTSPATLSVSPSSGTTTIDPENEEHDSSIQLAHFQIADNEVYDESQSFTVTATIGDVVLSITQPVAENDPPPEDP